MTNDSRQEFRSLRDAASDTSTPCVSIAIDMHQRRVQGNKTCKDQSLALLSSRLLPSTLNKFTKRPKIAHCPTKTKLPSPSPTSTAFVSNMSGQPETLPRQFGDSDASNLATCCGPRPRLCHVAPGRQLLNFGWLAHPVRLWRGADFVKASCLGLVEMPGPVRIFGTGCQKCGDRV